MRHLVGLLALVALVAIAIGALGLELPFGRLGGGGGTPTAARSGVRALGATTLLRVGVGAPAGGELAFLAVEPSGNLVVTDRARKSVLRFDAAGHLLSEWGPRLGDMTIVEPAGVAVAGDSYYVLDRGQPRIFQLDANGRLQSWFSLEGQGPYGLNGLAVDPSSGNLFVADTGRNRILVYAPNGTFIRQFGRRGTGLGELIQPMSMAFLPDGSLVVSDWENSRLERWDSTFDATDAWSIGYHAFGVTADQDGRVYAPDPERKRIGVYSATGDTLGEIGGPGGTPLEVSPRQVAIGPAQPKSLYVLGGDGIVRVDLDSVAAPAPASSDTDLLSPIVLVLLLALPVAALLLRRGRSARGSVAAASDGEVRLQAEDGAQGQHQQPQANQEAVVAHQAEREHESADQHHEPVRDRQTDHRD